MKITSQTVAAFVALVSLSSSSAYVNPPAFVPSRCTTRANPSSIVAAPFCKTSLYATVEETTTDSGLDDNILSRISEAAEESKQWAEAFDLTSESGAAFYALFSGIRSSAALGLKGKPFHLKSKDVLKAIDSSEGAFDGFFTFDDLAKALEDDFLDADRGSTDNRQGWKVSTFGLVCTVYELLYEL